ncbi:MAG: hypothetical protein JXR07_16925 [Reichenbachiella sp.]
MSDQLNNCTSLIRSHFQLGDQELLHSESFEKLEKSLTSIISYMLDKDFNRLLNAFYKIDLDEQKFKEILANTSTEILANSLAKEVITRELQKVETRLKYKS